MKTQAKNRYREYRLTVPAELSDEIRRIAKANDVQEIDVLRQFLKLGLTACNGGTLYVEKDGEYCELVIFGEAQAQPA